MDDELPQGHRRDHTADLKSSCRPNRSPNVTDITGQMP